MAIYVLQIKMVSRSTGRSAPAAAAYRSGTSITNERTEIEYSYVRKSGVESAEIFLPKDAPEWAADRSELWNAVERIETRKNSQVAREFIVALPAELSPSERKRLVHDFVKELVERHGVAADVTIHAPGRGGDIRNHHAHILLTTRRLGKDGFTEKTREFQRGVGSELVTYWRQRWQDLQNERLAENGSDARVDCRTNAAQGKGEPDIHYGHEVIGLERRTGEKSQVRLAHEAEVAERKQADQVLDNEIAVERDGVLQLKAMLEAAEQERVDQERLALSGSSGDAEVLQWWADRVDERAVEIKNNEDLVDSKPDDDDRQGLAVEVQAGADDAAVKKAEASLTADCPELAARVVQAQDRQRVREHQKKNLERRERVKKIKERDRLLASGPEGDAEVITWATERERAEVAERMVKARTAREPVDKALSENGRRQQDHQREKPEQPRGWFAIFKQRRYKRELAGWEAERSELGAKGQALEKKRDKLLRVERNVGGYTVRQVREDLTEDDLLMSDRLKKAKKRETKREKLEKLAREAPKIDAQERKAAPGVAAEKQAAEKPTESAAAKTVREFNQERDQRMSKRVQDYRNADMVIAAKLKKAEANLKVDNAAAPERRMIDFGFKARHGEWHDNNQALKKQVGELRSEHDRLENMGQNYQAMTTIEVITEMRKENPARWKDVQAAREVVDVEEREKIRERIAERNLGQGHDQGHDQGIGD